MRVAAESFELKLQLWTYITIYPESIAVRICIGISYHGLMASSYIARGSAQSHTLRYLCCTLWLTLSNHYTLPYPSCVPLFWHWLHPVLLQSLRSQSAVQVRQLLSPMEYLIVVPYCHGRPLSTAVAAISLWLPEAITRQALYRSL